MVSVSTSIPSESVEKRLRSLIRVTDVIVTIGLFLFIFRIKLGLQEYISATDLLNFQRVPDFIAERGLMAILAIGVMYIFITWRSSARREIDIASELFSRSRTPQRWTGVAGHQVIVVLVVTFYLLFFMLAWSVDNIRAFALTMSALYCIAFTSQFLRIRNLKRYFSDPRYWPLETDEHREFIMRRREVAANYLFPGQHLIKEGLVVFFSLLALVLSIMRDDPSPANLWSPSYMIIFAMIVVNEIFTFRWRRQRNEALAQIDADQARADQERLRERD